MLVAFQELFVRLCADAALRARLAARPEEVFQEHDLTAREREALLGIPREALERYARSLVDKRARELGKRIPLTRRVSPGVLGRYRAFLERSPAPAADPRLDPGCAEGLRALRPLHAELAADDGEAAYAADLFAFEVLRAASRSDGEERRFRSGFRIDRVARIVESGALPIDPAREPSLFRFTKEGVQVRPGEEA